MTLSQMQQTGRLFAGCSINTFKATFLYINRTVGCTFWTSHRAEFPRCWVHLFFFLWHSHVQFCRWSVRVSIVALRVWGTENTGHVDMTKLGHDFAAPPDLAVFDGQMIQVKFIVFDPHPNRCVFWCYPFADAGWYDMWPDPPFLVKPWLRFTRILPGPDPLKRNDFGGDTDGDDGHIYIYI